MTAVTTPPAVTAAEPRARFRDLGAAEWLKFWSLRSTPWSFVISALVILGLNAGAAYEHIHYWHANRFAPATFIADGLPLLDAFTSNAAIAMIVAAGAIGTLAVTGEYGTGRRPRRGRGPAPRRISRLTGPGGVHGGRCRSSSR